MQSANEVDWARLEKELVYEERPFRVSQMRSRAMEFGISLKAAIQMRRRFLLEELENWAEYIESPIMGFYSFDGLFRLPFGSLFEITEELKALPILLQPPSKDEVTQEMIDRANAVRIDEIVEFRNGMVRCINPDHEDKNPSMYHATKVNRAMCQGCGASYDAIGVIMKTEGLKFKDAVRRLCN